MTLVTWIVQGTDGGAKQMVIQLSLIRFEIDKCSLMSRRGSYQGFRTQSTFLRKPVKHRDYMKIKECTARANKVRCDNSNLNQGC